MSGAWIALGANLGDPQAQLRGAAHALAALPATRLQAASRLWRTPAWGPVPQPDYLNAVVVLETALEPEPLLDALLTIERAHGRTRGPDRYGPRTLDLDLLLHGTLQLTTPRLVLPHPRLAERAFVLLPLAELAPDLEIPGHGRRVRELLLRVNTGGCTALGPLL